MGRAEERLEVMAEQGYHAHDDCVNEVDRSRCPSCREGIVPWAEVPEPVKEVNRRGVRAFLSALGCKGDVVPDVGGAVEALGKLPCKCPKSVGLLAHYECFRCHSLHALRGEKGDPDG